ncbi:hypothetical protein D3Y57_16785 [Sphingomonas paeninsulae]|uniref:Uncharacterized protein n=1 Tax=Sphingomonas paeninsulae TaxID=2319844 RepID=A0A494TCU2_SPHPE|nr:hypothetical protein [Sphingomonas paeninsulae]AYJ87287.1 hypothetical protein D3Y57_16785 [Sphingomonas paeninsulae]
MAIYEIDDEVLNSEAAAGYFERADKRALMGLRATCEILGLPLPDYALRRKPGRTPAGDVMRAYAVDHPVPRPLTLAPRKEDAIPERIAAVRAANAARLNRAATLSV